MRRDLAELMFSTSPRRTRPDRPSRDDASPTAGEAAPRAVATPLTVPEGSLIGLGARFADLFARYLEVPRAFLFFAFLTYFGAVVARKITLDSALTPEPRLYTVVLGDSADTRKSTALRKTDDFFRSLGPPGRVPVLFGVGSAEGIAAQLGEGPDLLLHFDEFKSFVDKARNEHSIALPMVSTLFERGDYDNRTKESKVSVRDARLSVLGACTSDTYASLFDHQFHAIGFLNRLWLVVDRSSARIAVPAPIPLTDLEALRQAVLERLAVLDADYTAAGLQAVRYRLTPDALGCFRAWYEAREGSIFERRLDTYGHRLMLLLAATTGHREINADVAGRVVALLRYQLEVRREVDPVDAETLIAAVEEKVRRALARGALKGRDLKRKIHADRVGIWAWETALANLKRTGEVAHDRGSDVFWRPDPVAGVTTTVTTPPIDESTNGHATF